MARTRRHGVYAAGRLRPAEKGPRDFRPSPPPPPPTTTERNASGAPRGKYDDGDVRAPSARPRYRWRTERMRTTAVYADSRPRPFTLYGISVVARRSNRPPASIGAPSAAEKTSPAGSPGPYFHWHVLRRIARGVSSPSPLCGRPTEDPGRRSQPPSSWPSRLSYCSSPMAGSPRRPSSVSIFFFSYADRIRLFLIFSVLLETNTTTRL